MVQKFQASLSRHEIWCNTVSCGASYENNTDLLLFHGAVEDILKAQEDVL